MNELGELLKRVDKIETYEALLLELVDTLRARNKDEEDFINRVVKELRND